MSPTKFKKPLSLRTKNEVETPIAKCDLENTPTKGVTNRIPGEVEDSINLLKPIRYVANQTYLC